MRCPQCIKEDKKSIVTMGTSYTTAVYFPTQWDEDGKLMPSGQNTTSTEYSCSNGHRWTE